MQFIEVIFFLMWYCCLLLFDKCTCFPPCTVATRFSLKHMIYCFRSRLLLYDTPDSKIHGANMGPTWVLSAPDGPHVCPMKLAIRDVINGTHHMMTTSNGNFSLLLVLCEGNPPVTHKCQWHGALTFSLIFAWTNGWTNNRDAGNWRRHRAQYGVTVMLLLSVFLNLVFCQLTIFSVSPDPVLYVICTSL